LREAYAEAKKSHKHGPSFPENPTKAPSAKKIFATDKEWMIAAPESNLSLSLQGKRQDPTLDAEGAKVSAAWSFIPLPESISLPQSRQIMAAPPNRTGSFWPARKRKNPSVG